MNRKEEPTSTSGEEKAVPVVNQNTIEFNLLVQLLDELKCSVCLELFEEPLALPCLHTFCYRCLKEVVEDHSVTCPLCRSEHQLELKELKVNWDVKKVVDVMRQATARLCEECQEKKVTRHCKQCEADLCENCDRKIHSIRLLRDHTRHEISPADILRDNKIELPDENPIQDDDIVVDFVIRRDACLKKLHDWEASLWFAPTDLKQVQNLRLNTPLLLPYWLFEVETYSKYSANGTIMAGNRRFHSSWFKFNDVTIGQYRHAVCASDCFCTEDLNKIEPWALDDLRPRNRAFESDPPLTPRAPLSNRAKPLPFVVDEQQAWVTGKGENKAVCPTDKSVVEEIILKMARQDCEKAMMGKLGSVGGFRDLVVNTSITRIAAQRVFLPVYMIRYVYNGKSYLVLVNGQTGQLYGERPYAFGKVAALSVTGVAGLFGLLRTH